MKGGTRVNAATWSNIVIGALNVVVLAVYAWFTWGIWDETRNSALRSEELVRQAREALKIHLLGTYCQVRTSAAPYEVDQGEDRSVIHARFRMLEVQLEKAFPELWEQLSRRGWPKTHKETP